MTADAADANDAADSTDWVARVPEESRACLKKVLFTSIDARWKVRLMQPFFYLPGPMSKGVKRTKVKGVGAFYYPVDEKGEEASARPSSAILWIHGGGRILGRASGVAEDTNCSRIVKMTGVAVFSAEHRLAPANPFPAALDDIHKAYHWLANDLKSKGKSDVKIAVCGESAGGGYAAELCQRLLDESQEQTEPSVPLPVCQGLWYPMLDDRTCVDEELCKLPPHLIWNNSSNMYGWSSYFGPKCKPGDAEVPKYASASRREDLTGLPPAQIQVGDLDLFLKEDTDYANRLKRDGVETEFVEIKGAFHGMFSLGSGEPLSDEMWERFAAFVKKYLLD
ncbi:hypothetical protein ACHAXT_007571 [Thalassiosira profunda]